MLAPMLGQLNLKLTASNIRALTIDNCQRKMIKTKQTFAGKMVSVKVDSCTQKKRIYSGFPRSWKNLENPGKKTFLESHEKFVKN